MSFIGNLSRRFIEEKKGSVYNGLNLLCLVFASVILFAGVHYFPAVVSCHLANPQPETSVEFFGPALFRYGAEQRIIFSAGALKYQFWIFIFLFIRNTALLIKSKWSLPVGALGLAAAFVIAIDYARWAPLLDEWSWMLRVPKWIFGCLVVLMAMVAAIDLVIVVLLTKKSKITA